jgi:replicative DNA helicase
MTPRKQSHSVPDGVPLVEPDSAIANLACERVALGGCLECDEIQDSVFASGILEPSDFSLTDFQRVYQAIKDLRERNLPADIVSVCEKLGNQSADYALCSDLITGVVLNVRHVLYHCEIVRSKARLRRIREIAEWIGYAVGQPGTDPDCLVKSSCERLASL